MKFIKLAFYTLSIIFLSAQLSLAIGTILVCPGGSATLSWSSSNCSGTPYYGASPQTYSPDSNAISGNLYNGSTQFTNIQQGGTVSMSCTGSNGQTVSDSANLVLKSQAECGCPAGQSLINGTCQTPSCSNGLDISSYPSCTCPAGQIQSGNTCQTNNCSNGLNINNYPGCICPAGQIQSGNSCVNNTCPNGQVLINGKCQYQKGVCDNSMKYGCITGYYNNPTGPNNSGVYTWFCKTDDNGNYASDQCSWTDKINVPQKPQLTCPYQTQANCRDVTTVINDGSSCFVYNPNKSMSDIWAEMACFFSTYKSVTNTVCDTVCCNYSGRVCSGNYLEDQYSYGGEYCGSNTAQYCPYGCSNGSCIDPLPTLSVSRSNSNGFYGEQSTASGYVGGYTNGINSVSYYCTNGRSGTRPVSGNSFSLTETITTSMFGPITCTWTATNSAGRTVTGTENSNFRQRDPVGNIDTINTTTGNNPTLIGWTADQDDLTKPVTINATIDGRPLISNYVCDKSNSGTTYNLGTGNHGCGPIDIPASYCDGNTHTVIMTAFNTIPVRGTDSTFTKTFNCKPTGRFTAPNPTVCIIPRGQNSCNPTTISWTTEMTGNIVRVTRDSAPFYSTITGPSGASQVANGISYAGDTFDLFGGPFNSNQGSYITTMIVRGTCAAGDKWDGSKCVDSSVPSGVITATNCIIKTGFSTCNSTVVWTTADLLPGVNTAVTYNKDGTPTTLSTQVKGTSTVAIPFGDTNFFIYHNANELNQATAKASCELGSKWNTSTKKCESTNEGTGVITATDCVIPVGQSKCNSNISWNTVNANPVEVTKNNPDGGSVSTNPNGNNMSVSINFGNTNFYIYSGGQSIASPATAKATCATGSSWDGTKCKSNQGPQAAIVNVTPVPGSDNKFNVDFQCKNSTSYEFFARADGANAVSVKTGTVPPENQTVELTLSPDTAVKWNLQLVCRSALGEDKVDRDIANKKNTPARIDKFSIYPNTVVCGGADTVLSWEVGQAKDKGCNITADAIKDSQKLTENGNEVLYKNSQELADLRYYVASTTNSNSKVELGVKGVLPSTVFNTVNSQGTSIGEIVKVPLKHSTKFTLTCPTPTPGVSKSVVGIVACQGEN